MADQGVWFKLWCSALADPDLSNLSLEDFARWAILGTYIKAHGTAGALRLTAPARALSGLLQVGDFMALQEVFHRLPNVVVEKENFTVSSETILTVSFRNWAKYQGDFSTPRVRKMREMKRSKRRGEEKRQEETRIPPYPPGDLSPNRDHVKNAPEPSGILRNVPVDPETAAAGKQVLIDILAGRLTREQGDLKLQRLGLTAP